MNYYKLTIKSLAMTMSKISPSRTINKGVRGRKRGHLSCFRSIINLEGVLCGLGCHVCVEAVPDRNTSSAYEYERAAVTAYGNSERILDSENMFLSTLLKVLGQLMTLRRY